jgi:hypothetical protein
MALASKLLAATGKSIDSNECSVTNGIIIGGGRIGNFLYEENDKKDQLISKRGDPISSDSSGPIYICTRNNDLAGIIEATPANRKEDLVFLQNGILTDFLTKFDLNENTQALIYLAVSKKGEKPIDGITSLNPDGLTAVFGKWSHDLKSRLNRAGLTCKVLDKPTWTVAMVSIISLHFCFIFFPLLFQHGIFNLFNFSTYFNRNSWKNIFGSVA